MSKKTSKSNLSTKNLLKRSQKRINELKDKIKALSQEENKKQPQRPMTRVVHKPSQEIRVVLSIESIVKATFAVFAVVGLFYLLFFIKEILIIFLVALFLSAAFNPAVDRLQAYKIPRALGIIIMYAIVLGIIIFIFTSLVPIIANQVTSLAFSVRDMVQNIVSGEETDSWIVQNLQSVANQVWQNVDQTQVLNSLTSGLREVGSKLTNFAGNAIGAIFVVFNGLFNLVLVLIITFFMILNKQNTANFFHSLFPKRYSAYITDKMAQVSERIGEWIRGQVFLALAMALLTFIVFTTIGLNFALTLAMVSALGEFIPYLGPLITFFSAALIALNQDPVLVLWLIPAYAVIQFLEGNIMVPLIIGKSVGLNPIVILFALLSGATLGIQLGGSYGLGLVGMIIAVPVANIISIFIEEYTEKNK